MCESGNLSVARKTTCHRSRRALSPSAFIRQQRWLTAVALSETLSGASVSNCAAGENMSFNLGAGRRPAAEMNVTPLIDVLLVLLIIFMIITPMDPHGLFTEI